MKFFPLEQPLVVYIGDAFRVTYPRWRFLVTRRTLNDFPDILFPKRFICVGYVHDTDCYEYTDRTIAWARKLYYLWCPHRWCIERFLTSAGIFLVIPGYHLNTWNFNWNWRWYDKSTWQLPFRD